MFFQLQNVWKIGSLGGSCSCKQVPGYHDVFWIGGGQMTAAVNVPECNFSVPQLWTFMWACQQSSSVLGTKATELIHLVYLKFKWKKQFFFFQEKQILLLTFYSLSSLCQESNITYCG